MKSLLAGAALWTVAASSWAQKTAHVAPVPEPVGSVMGHVVCSDTQRPARFADVYLLPKTEPVKPGAAKVADGKEKATVMMVQGRTALDGSFLIRNLQPGDYYAVAHGRGYLVPVAPDPALEKVDYRKLEELDLSKAYANFPVVHVAADRASNVELTMRRGGVIAGRVLFDDGSPVSNMFMLLTRADGKDTSRQYVGRTLSSIDQEDSRVLTDDEGRYRAVGLAPGKYFVHVDMWTELEERTVGTSRTWGVSGSDGFIRQSLDVYSPGSFRKADAKTIEIRGDEQHNDTDILVKLDGLHTVRGRLLGGEDHHPVTRAYVTLRDGTDFERGASVVRDGTFHFSYVPAGTYTIKVTYAADTKVGDDLRSEKTLHSYGKAEQSVIVAEHDVTVDDIDMPEQVKTEGKKQPDDDEDE